MTAGTIEIKDKVMSPEQFRDFTADLNRLIANSGVSPQNVSFNAEWKGNDKIGIYSSILLKVDETIEPDARQLLQLHGFIDKADSGIPVLDRPAVRDAVREYVRVLVKESDSDIEWALAYDLKNPANICLLYLAPEVVMDPDGRIVVYRMLPDLPVVIPGRLLISFSSPAELELALQKKPDQPILQYLLAGDFEVIHGPAGKSPKSVISWAGSADA